ncbi:MAG: hypothetical protein OEV91_05905 [Desulfobulbaceae bacterium]|nr:hypothetical protein [Desulfobulbaceae bacterium]
MPDTVSLHIGSRAVVDFKHYRIDADLYLAGAAFEIEAADPGFPVSKGARCQIKVNGVTVLNGIADLIDDGGGKDGMTIRIDGRDLMGLVVDSYVDEFITMQDVTLKALAEKLLVPLPFIGRSDIVYQAGVAGARAAATTTSNPLLDKTQAKAQIEPGQTVFDVFKDYTRSRGLLFWMLPAGTFVFGRPKARGAAAFHLTRRLDGRDNNVLTGRRIRDVSQQYRTIKVMGQQQGRDALSAEAINTSATVTDADAPIAKTKVIIDNNDDQSPSARARLELERQRARALRFVYKVQGHTQGGKPWTINELCRIDDDDLHVHGSFLVTGRTMEIDKEIGPVTEVRLSLPGVIQ